MTMHALFPAETPPASAAAWSARMADSMIARHTPEGYDFQRRAAEAGFREAVRERDEPFGDLGLR